MPRLRSLPFAIAVLLASAPLAAQTVPPAEADSEELDRVVVTGSNLRGVDLAESQPVVVLDREAIEASGATTIPDLVRQISESGGGTGNFSTANSGALQADSPAGQAGISLRGLGTASTLTLVNGRRIAASSFANGSENFVDVNAIPLAAVERVEVLTTGASAVYGADAVAGVVNFILRKDFEGLRLEASYGDSTRGTDEGRYNANLVYGFQGDRVNGLFVFDAFQRNALYDRDRAISAVEPRPSQQGFFPSIGDGSTRPELVESACPRSQFGTGRLGEFCTLNRNAYTATDPESRQLGAYGMIDVRLSDSLEYFTELALQRNRAQADAAPAPWDNELIAFNHPNFPAELRQRLIAGGYTTTNLRGYGRFPDARTIEVDTTSWRWLNGLRGQIGEWDWETALTYSRSESTQEAVAGIYNRARVRAGLVGTLCADGSTTCAPGAGGLWYNPFGGQADNSAQVLDLLRERVPRDGTSTLAMADAKLAGSWGAIGDRPIAWAMGAEARRERAVDAPSPLATANPANNNQVPVYGFGSTAVSAERTQWAAYVETNLPLASTLDVRLAGRYDHYDDFGGDFNPSVGLRWKASDAVVVRGGWNTSFRAPSLAQVGAGTTLSSGALPCSPGSEFFATFCGGFAGDDSYLSEIYGNPDLKPETAKAWYLGTVLQLGAATTLTLDWFDFEQDDLVDIDDLELFRRALADPSLIYATSPRPTDLNQRRLSPGVLGIATRRGRIGDAVDTVQLELINIGRQATDGLDFALDHRIDSDFGRIKLFVDGTWTHSFIRSESCAPGSTSTRRGAGTCGADGQRDVELVGEFRYPEWLVNAGVGWSSGDWSARLWANHIDGYFDDDQRAEVPAGRRVASWTTLNLNVDWDFSETQSVGVNIRNLADRDPPVSLGSASNVDLYNHNTLGRFVTVRYVHRF